MDQSEENMQLAWKVFDSAGKGELDASEFRKSLPLMGEDVPDEKVIIYKAERCSCFASRLVGH